MNIQTQSRFKRVESFKHKYAKWLLRKWLLDKFIRVDFEKKFLLNGVWLFVADLACYDENGLNCIYEVCHTNFLDETKLNKIYDYQYVNKIYFKIYEINADWILNQVQKPEKLKYFDFSISNLKNE